MVSGTWKTSSGRKGAGLLASEERVLGIVSLNKACVMSGTF